MRIAHVTATFPPNFSGTGVVCYHQAIELARIGHDVTVFTTKYPLGTHLDPKELEVIRHSPVLRFGNAPLLPALFRLKNFDLIHLHYPFIFGAEIISFVSLYRNIPCVLTHHNDLIGKGLRKHLFNLYSAVTARTTISIIRKFAVLSFDHALSSNLQQHFRKRMKDLIEIPNGVDTELFFPDETDQIVRKHLGINESTKIILFIGVLDRAHHFKGLDTLLEAFSLLKANDNVLLVVGDGELRNDYEKTSFRFGISDRTHFMGTVVNKNLPSIYRAADVLVLPSFRPESFGIVLLEAMACGKPVIASNIPGVRQVFHNGKEGLLVTPGDIEDLKDKINYIINNTDIQRQMGREGRRLVERKYTWPRITDKLEKLYSDIV